MKKEFSSSGAIKYGWQTMKKNFWFFVGVSIIVGLIRGVFYALPMVFERESAMGLLWLFHIISWVIQIIVSIGLITIALKFLDNTKAELNDLFSFMPYFWQYLLAWILYALIVLAGTILLIVPGIIWAIKFQYFGYFIVDKKLSAVEALKKSSALTNGVKSELFSFGIELFCINMLGALCLLVGLFATIPTTLLAYAMVYRKLLSQMEAEPLPAEVKPAP